MRRRQRYNTDNIFPRTAAGEIVDRLRDSLQHRSVGFRFSKPLYQFIADISAVQVREDQNIGFAGACHATADTLRPALQILKTAPGVKLVSGFFILDVPDCTFGENGTFLFADCGLNQDPTAEELAAIADTSAKSFKSLVGAKPIIAMNILSCFPACT